MDYELSFAGTPLLGDLSRVYRAKGYEEARKHEPLADLMDELERLIPSRYLQDLAPGAKPTYPSQPLALPDRPQQDARATQVKVGEWYYPTTAQRFSIFRGLATSSMAKSMLSTTGGTKQATFIMQAVPVVAFNAGSYKLSTSMYMLPPRPLGEEADKKFDGLFLITLVDERFYFGGSPVTLRPTATTTWDALITQCASALGISPIVYSTIPAAYGQPQPDSPLWCNFENAAILLDAIATNVGKVVVRNFDGTYSLKTYAESQSQVVTNRGTNVVRVAGGDLFNSGNLLVAGELTKGRNAVIPASVTVTFPKYVYGADPVPHFLNPRTTSGRQSVWYEAGVGDVHAVTVTPASGGPNVSGLQGVSNITVRTDAKALYATEALARSGIAPTNISGLTALAMRVAGDRYDSVVAAALDEVYPGTLAWTPEGIHDIVWTYSEKAGLASTRAMRQEWNTQIEEGQYAIPFSGSIVASGVGGRSVAQTWRDSDKTIQFGVNLVTAGTGLTLTKGAVTSGGISEAILATATTPAKTTNNTWYWSGEVGIDFMEGPNLFSLSPIFIGLWTNLSGFVYNFWPFFQLHGCFNMAGQPPADPLAAPGATASGSGGTIPAGTYYFLYTNVDGKDAESAPSADSVQVTIVGDQIVNLTFPALPSDTESRNLYVTAAGGAPGSETMAWSGITDVTFQYTGTTSVTDPFVTGQSPPAADVHSNADSCFNPPDCCLEPTWKADGGSMLYDRCSTSVPRLWIQQNYPNGTAWNCIIGTANPGDMIYGDQDGEATILPIGQEGSIFMVVGGVPTWVLPAGRVAGTLQLLGMSAGNVLSYFSTSTQQCT